MMSTKQTEGRNSMNKPEHFKILEQRREQIEKELDKRINTYNIAIENNPDKIAEYTQIKLAYAEAKIIVNENMK